MEIFLFIIVVLVCLLLMGVVLVQNSKGGGLSADFSSSNQYMGVRKTSDFLEKATWGLAIGLFVMCLLTTAVSTTSNETVSVESTMAEIADEYTTDLPSNAQLPPSAAGAEVAVPVE